MGSGDLPALRSVPRVFVPGASMEGPIDLPKEEVDKLRKVLRLAEGDPIAVLPNDGSIIRCEFRHRQALPKEVEWPQTEAPFRLTLAQALPKSDRIDTIVRMSTEIGVHDFCFFTAERSVVRWDEARQKDRTRRLEAIARESCEQCFRTRIPGIEFVKDLKAVLERWPEAVVLSESEGVSSKLVRQGEAMTIVVGPEGGWGPREMEIIGKRGVTLGPRVLRTDTAGPAAAAILLLA